MLRRCSAVFCSSQSLLSSFCAMAITSRMLLPDWSFRRTAGRPSVLRGRTAQHAPVVHTSPGSSLQLVVRLLFHSYAALQISARSRAGCSRRDVGPYTCGGLDHHSGHDHWRRRNQSCALGVDDPTSDPLEGHAELLHVSENHGTSVRTSSTRSIFAVLVGAKVGGIVGIYLAVPLTATLRVVWRTYAVPKRAAGQTHQPATKQR